jgi:hypothetical protein
MIRSFQKQFNLTENRQIGRRKLHNSEIEKLLLNFRLASQQQNSPITIQMTMVFMKEICENVDRIVARRFVERHGKSIKTCETKPIEPNMHEKLMNQLKSTSKS